MKQTARILNARAVALCGDRINDANPERFFKGRKSKKTVVVAVTNYRLPNEPGCSSAKLVQARVLEGEEDLRACLDRHSGARCDLYLVAVEDLTLYAHKEASRITALRRKRGQQGMGGYPTVVSRRQYRRAIWLRNQRLRRKEAAAQIATAA